MSALVGFAILALCSSGGGGAEQRRQHPVVACVDTAAAVPALTIGSVLGALIAWQIASPRS
jgi:uncharacterized membrane protein|eukprot:COSAG01_NODE_1763_length_9284_cov_67.515079_8_plen_61_part_00